MMNRDQAIESIKKAKTICAWVEIFPGDGHAYIHLTRRDLLDTINLMPSRTEFVMQLDDRQCLWVGGYMDPEPSTDLDSIPSEPVYLETTSADN